MRRESFLLLATVMCLPLATAHAGDHALLMLVDRSASMADDDKWSLTVSGTVQGLDDDVFDSFDLGLVMAPSGSVTGPLCIFELPVSCAVPLLPQRALGAAGAKSSAGAGARQDIRDLLLVNPPATGLGDGFPLFGAMQTAIAALQNWPGTGDRILVLVTDGGLSCNQLSSPPRPGFADCNGCDHEWEHPQNLVDLIAQAHADGSTPIDTFVVGAPGADVIGDGCTDPPYSLRLALSTMANAGSDEVPGDCTGDTFTQMGGDPSIPCHYDLTVGTYDADAVADVLIEVGSLSGPDPSQIFADGFESGSTAAWN